MGRDDIMNVTRAEINRVTSFIEVAGHWPSELSPLPVESELGAWLNATCRLYSAGMLSMRERVMLERHLPGWKHRGEDLWLAHAREASSALIGFVSGLGDLSLASRVWIGQQLSLDELGILAADQRVWLDAHAPRWREISAAYFAG